MYFSSGKVIAAFLCGVVGGAIFFVQWLDVYRDRQAPLMTGHVIARRPCKVLGLFPRTDLTIRLEDGTEVHSRVGHYVSDKVQDSVRFRYAGDPAKEVFLIDFENSPFWIFVMFWAGALVLGLFYYWQRIRKPKSRSIPPAASGFNEP